MAYAQLEQRAMAHPPHISLMAVAVDSVMKSFWARGFSIGAGALAIALSFLILVLSLCLSF
jgi:hypothetical protein